MPKVTIAQNILAANDSIASELQQGLRARGMRIMNLMSSPGAGKTTLLERTIQLLGDDVTIGVIEGDIETTTDAERIEALGAQVVQINTRGACHLEAHMVRDALQQLDLTGLHLLCIENIGNLVCPASWHLGEEVRVILVSLPEGDEKPSKYPQMFATAHVMLINKLDLLPYVDYDIAKVQRQARAINPRLRIYEVSCRSGEGLEAWCDGVRAFVAGGQWG